MQRCPTGRMMPAVFCRGSRRRALTYQAFAAIPLGPEHTQLVFFPDDPQRLTQIADTVGFALTGPQRAFLVQGDDRLGAIADIYGKLSQVEVSVYASTGVTDGRGGFGYILWISVTALQTPDTGKS